MASDDHHDNRYEDGDESTGTVEDYADSWQTPVHDHNNGPRMEDGRCAYCGRTDDGHVDPEELA